MTDALYSLPADLSQDIEEYGRDVQRSLAGEIPGGILKAKRVPRGVYEQRQDGTYMVRIRVAAGRLTAPQAAVVADLAKQFGDGMLHVTTRQDVQLHGVAIRDTPEIMRRLLEVGLTSKGGGGNTVRNVAACPYAGVCPCEPFDVTPFATDVTEYLIGLVGSYNLPRKYKIAFSGCAADCAIARANDLGFIAETRNGRAGFRVYAGGGMGAHSRTGDILEEWVPATDVIRVAEAIRRIFDRLGDRHNRRRARLRFVFERTGVPAFREQFRREFEAVSAEGVPASDSTPKLRDSQHIASPGNYVREPVDGLDMVRQHQDGLVSVSIHLPLGFVSWPDFRSVAQLAERFSGEAGLRTLRTQNLMLRSVRETALPELARSLRELTLDVSSGRPLERFVACAGASTCRLGLCLSRGAAEACATELDKLNIPDDALRALDINISGCPNACGHHPVASVGLFGAAQRSDGKLVPSYRVVLAARRGNGDTRLAQVAGTVPARTLPAFLGDIASDFATGRETGESFAAYFDRVGATHFEPIIENHASIPGYDVGSDFYRDWGQTDDFSLAGRGAGECGAGVFEVVHEDLLQARKALENDHACVFDVFLPTVRALLITRGVDSRAPAEMISTFEEHFIETGLVSDGFRPLLSSAREHLGGSSAALRNRRDDVERLLERIELLYSTMDAGLQFHPPETGTTPVPAENRAKTVAAGTLDLRGVACPMNFVKAKLKLETMNIGEMLEMILDDGEPVQNVPASFRNEGQAIVETAGLADGLWRVVVQKNR